MHTVISWLIFFKSVKFIFLKSVEWDYFWARKFSVILDHRASDFFRKSQRLHEHMYFRSLTLSIQNISLLYLHRHEYKFTIKQIRNTKNSKSICSAHHDLVSNTRSNLTSLDLMHRYKHIIHVHSKLFPTQITFYNDTI